MNGEKSERSVPAWWVAAGVVVLLVAAPAAGQAVGLSRPGLALGALLAALGVRLAVMAGAVRAPAETPGATAARGRHPERLRPAHV